MATIAENLQTLVEQKAAIKAALNNKGKEPTDALATYAGLIDELENEEQITYAITNADGTQKIYGVKAAAEAVTLTATENDIRLGSTAITNKGYTEGAKDIPAYHSLTGKKIIQDGAAVTITTDNSQFTHIHAMLSTYDTSILKSVAVYANVVEGVLYAAGSNTKLADLTVDESTNTIRLGITAQGKTVLRYFIMREET